MIIIIRICILIECLIIINVCDDSNKSFSSLRDFELYVTAPVRGGLSVPARFPVRSRCAGECNSVPFSVQKVQYNFQ